MKPIVEGFRKFAAYCHSRTQVHPDSFFYGGLAKALAVAELCGVPTDIALATASLVASGKEVVRAQSWSIPNSPINSRESEAATVGWKFLMTALTSLVSVAIYRRVGIIPAAPVILHGVVFNALGLSTALISSGMGLREIGDLYFNRLWNARRKNGNTNPPSRPRPPMGSTVPFIAAPGN